MNIPRWAPPWLRRFFNPRNLTRLHLAREAQRYGYAIGDHSYGAPTLRFPFEAKLTIGRFCSFADQVQIFMGGDHRMDFVSTYPFGSRPEWPVHGQHGHARTRGDVVIGSDVWVGSGAVILSGVTIGHGAVIGARAVVARDVAPYTIVAGNPAKLIRQRFDDATVAALVETAWWNLPDDKIAALTPLLQSAEMEQALAAIRAARSV